MRVPTFRFTIRRFMIAVAILATLMASGIMASRLSLLRAGFQERARFHEQESQEIRDWLSSTFENAELRAALRIENPPLNSEDDAVRMASLSEEDRQEQQKADEEVARVMEHFEEMKRALAKASESARKEIEYHEGLTRKYREAAKRPWKSVPPDAKDPGYNILYLMDLWLRVTNMAATQSNDDGQTRPSPANKVEAATEEGPASRDTKP